MSRSGQFKARYKGRSGVLKRNGLSAERIIFFLKRVGLYGGAAIFFLWLSIWFFLSDAHLKTYDWARSYIISEASEIGFEVQNLVIEGRGHTDLKALKTALDIEKGSPLFAQDLTSKKEKVEQLSWVDAVHIERRFPDTVYVRIDEKEPLALWQNKGKLFLVDVKGQVITDRHLKNFKDMVTLIGAHAPEQAPEFMGLLASEVELIPYIGTLRLMSGRRWDLILKNGIVIQLPEKDLPLGLRRLVTLQADQNIFDKDIILIDMRHPSRIVIKNKSGRSENYESGSDKSEN
ncbi:MAG: FtsQ-type POTRA domain-containing protein [Alphaproteobacteria bacterium]|nr:FtsQ-type POTRA domain-containing protein [Alphaproteobacteria bacterium]